MWNCWPRPDPRALWFDSFAADVSGEFLRAGTADASRYHSKWVGSSTDRRRSGGLTKVASSAYAGQNMNLAEYELEISSTEAEGENIRALRDLFICRGSVDAWEHERMLKFLSALINTYPDAHWLTLGDGGADAWILRNCGVRAVTASSLSDARLKKARDLGFYRAYLPGRRRCAGYPFVVPLDESWSVS